MTLQEAARFVVWCLLEDDQPQRYGQIVRVRTPKGVIKVHWNGYYDLRAYGKGLRHSVGYPDGAGDWTHGYLHPGDEILDPVPSFEEWSSGQGERNAAFKSRIARYKQELLRQ